MFGDGNHYFFVASLVLSLSQRDVLWLSKDVVAALTNVFTFKAMPFDKLRANGFDSLTPASISTPAVVVYER